MSRYGTELDLWRHKRPAHHPACETQWHPNDKDQCTGCEQARAKDVPRDGATSLNAYERSLGPCSCTVRCFGCRVAYLVDDFQTAQEAKAEQLVLW